MASLAGDQSQADPYDHGALRASDLDSITIEKILVS